ncbi:LOW QUALITY PROTEIN: A-kinase anchor protein 3 [Phoenicopterus ruber ruber]
MHYILQTRLFFSYTCLSWIFFFFHSLISDNIDWLQSQSACKVDHYILGGKTEQNWTRRVGQQEKEKCHHTHFGQDEFADSLSKEILIYVNNVVSVMKTMEGQANDSNIACIVLNLLLKHSKAMVSDLVGSCMKNLYDLAGKLLTNSDFASSVKPTVFTLGSCKAAEIVQAELNHLHSTLIEQKPGGKRLAYTSVKTGSRTDMKAQMRFAATRTETLLKEKEMTCADAVGNHIIRQGFTLWHENRNQCSQCAKSQPGREAEARSPRNMPWSSEIWDMVVFVCKVKGQPENPIVDETTQNTGKTTKGHIGLSNTERSCEEAVSGLTKMLTHQLNVSREDSSDAQFIGSLVDIVLKLFLMVVKYSSPESLLAEPGRREAVGSKDMGTADSVAASSKGTVSRHRVVVVNQNPSENVSSALLQWMIASQANVPVLCFLNGDEFMNKQGRN